MSVDEAAGPTEGVSDPPSTASDTVRAVATGWGSVLAGTAPLGSGLSPLAGEASEPDLVTPAPGAPSACPAGPGVLAEAANTTAAAGRSVPWRYTALTVDDVTPHPVDGLHVLVPVSKTDPEAQ